MKQHKIVHYFVALLLMLWCCVVQAAINDNPFFGYSVSLLSGGQMIGWRLEVMHQCSDFVLINSASGTAGNDIISRDVYTVLQNTLLPSPQGITNNAGNELLIRNTGPAGVHMSMTDNNNDSLLDAGDSFNSFELQSNTNVTVPNRSMNHSFYIASNVAFDIFAQAQNLQTSGDFTGLGLENIRWQMGIVRAGNDGLAYGSSAQNPSSGGLGLINGNAETRLDTMTSPTKVFDGGRRTAASIGSIAQQSVRFTARYALRRNATGTGSYDLSMGKGHIEADVTYTIFTP